MAYQNPRDDYEGPERLNAYGLFNEDNREDIEQFYELIISRILSHAKIGAFLEVGCARGDLLKIAARHGFVTSGVEIAPKNARTAQQHGKIFTGTLQEAGFADDVFDVVVMRHVFEHVPDPVDTLTEVRRILKPGGVLYLEVPNDRYLRTKIGVFSRLNADFIFGVKSHLFYYTMHTLSRIIASARFAKKEEGFWGFSTKVFADHSVSRAMRRRIPVRIALALLRVTKIDALLNFQDSMYQILVK